MKDSEISVGLPVAVVLRLPLLNVTLGADVLARRAVNVTGVVASYIPNQAGCGMWFVRHSDGVTAPYVSHELIRVLSWLDVREGKAVMVVRLQPDIAEKASWHQSCSNRKANARGTILGFVTDKLVLVRHESGEDAVYDFQELALDSGDSRDTRNSAG